MSDKIVEEHKKMVILSGQISDFQENNLKQYPFIVLDNLKNFEIEYDFTQPGTTENSNVNTICAGSIKYTFHFKEKPTYTEDEWRYRLGQIAGWVKYLFWFDTKIQFHWKDKKWVM